MAQIVPSPITPVATELRRIRTVNSNTTLLSTDYTVEVDASGGNIIITLPTAVSQFSGGSGRIYNIKKIDSTLNTVTINPTAPDTIDDLTSLVISAKDVAYTIQSNQIDWERL